MPKRKPVHVSQEAWDAVESPELSEELIKAMRPVSETRPEMIERYRRTRGSQKAPTKLQVTLRLDRDVVDHFKKGGSGWQTRINKALRDAAFG